MKVLLSSLSCLVTCLLAFAIIAAMLVHGTAPICASPIEDKKQAVRDDDYKILDLVLLDLLDFKDFNEAVYLKGTNIILSDRTRGFLRFLESDHSDAQSHSKKSYFIPADVRADLWQRNPEEPVPLRGFEPSSSKILMRDVTGLKQLEFFSKYRDSKGYVDVWLPGYSKDGQTAVLRAWFGPTPHGASATYMLAKKKGKWTIVWRRVRCYL